MIERRFTAHAEVRDSQGDEGSVMEISGYAARFGILSEPLGGAPGFRECLVPGCFQRSLQSDRDVSCLMNHDPNLILGRLKNKTLSVSEDARGLKFRCNVAPTSTGRDVYNLVKRGDITDCSFAFEVDGQDGQSWSEVDDPDNTGSRIALRTINRAKLFDVSVVGSPAYSGTSVSTLNPLNLNSYHRDLVTYFPEGTIPQSFPAEVRALLLQSFDNPVTRNHRRLIGLAIS